MTVLTLRALADEWGVPALVDATATVVVEQGWGPASRVVGPDVIFWRRLSSRITDGVADPPLELPVLPFGYHFHLTVTGPSGQVDRYFAPPTGDTVDVGDLVLVDPGTSHPDPTESIWTSFKDGIDAVGVQVHSDAAVASTAATDAAGAATAAGTAAFNAGQSATAASGHVTAAVTARDESRAARDASAVSAAASGTARDQAVTAKNDTVTALTPLTDRVGILEVKPAPTVDNLSGATTTGKNLMKADSPAFGRAAIGVRSPSDDDARFARKPRASRTIVFGDSTDAASQGWYAYYSMGSKRIQTIRNAGIGGNTTAMMLARLDADVLAYSPDVVTVGSTTNDQGTGVDEAVTRSNVLTLIDRIQATGATVVLRGTLPVDVVGAGAFNTIPLRRAGVQKYNAWLRLTAAKLGLDFLDVYQAVADPATGGYAAGITIDGVHPTEVGYKAIADYLLGLPIPAAWKGGFAFARATGEAGNLLADGVFAVDANTDGRADAWTIGGGTPTCSLTAAAVGISGKWQRVTTSTTATASILGTASTGFAAGDILEIVGRVRTSGGSTAMVRFQMNGTANQAIDVVASTTQPLDGIFSGRMTVQAGPTQLRVLVQNSVAAGWIEVSEVAVRNLTALGVA